MTVVNPTDTNRTPLEFIGDGSDATLNVNRPFYKLRVVQQDKVALGPHTVMVEGTNYDITGGGGAVGTIVIKTGRGAIDFISGTHNWVAYLDETPEQTDDIPENGDISSSSLEARLDRLTLVTNGLLDRNEKRTLRLPDGDSLAFANELPAVVSRANKVLGFSATGDVELIDFVQGTSTDLVTATSGSAAITHQNRWDSFLTPQDFATGGNDVGGDSNEDTANVQSAIDTKGVIYFPPGTYLLQNLLMGNNTSIVGEGNGVTIFQILDGSGASDAIIKQKPGGATNAEIRGISFVGNSANVTTSKGISMLDSDRMTIADCRFSDFEGTAIEMLDCDDITLTGIHVQNNLGPATIYIGSDDYGQAGAEGCNRLTLSNYVSLADAGSPLVLKRLDGGHISDVFCLNSSASLTTYPGDIYMDGCREVMVESLRSQGSDRSGVHIVWSALHNIKNNGIKLSHCTIEGSELDGIYADGVTRLNIENCTVFGALGAFSGIHLETLNSGSGAGLAGTGDSTVLDWELKDTTSVNNGVHGVFIEGCERGAISNCTIQNNTTNGIEIAVGDTNQSTQIHISDCLLGDTGGGTQNLGLSCISSTSEVVVKNCDFTGCADLPELILMTNTSSASWGEGNYGYRHVAIATVDVQGRPGGDIWSDYIELTASNGTALSDIGGLSPGRKMKILFNNATPPLVVDGGVGVALEIILNGAANWQPANKDTLDLICNGTNWFEVGRTTNRATTTDVTGFIAGAGASALAGSGWAGDAGATIYTVGDIVAALKKQGILPA